MSRPLRLPLIIRRRTEDSYRTRLPQIADAHPARSRAAILHVAEFAVPGAVVILGAGSCHEIPLKQLVGRFTSVRLIDEDSAALASAADIAELDSDKRRKLICEVRDLTGLGDKLSVSIELELQSLTPSSDDDAATWIDRLAAIVENLELPAQPLLPPADFVLISCVISQLHVTALHRAIGVIDAHAISVGRADLVSQLQQSTRWTIAFMNLARRLEARFIEDLAGVLASGGVAYVSDSVQMCFIQALSEGDWTSEGLHRMTRTPMLSDYFDARFEVVPLGEWAWIVDPPQKPFELGRAYRVQALRVKLAI